MRYIVEADGIGGKYDCAARNPDEAVAMALAHEAFLHGVRNMDRWNLCSVKEIRNSKMARKAAKRTFRVNKVYRCK